ncbi:MAG: chemotaxis protein CheW [Sphingomonas sp.]
MALYLVARLDGERIALPADPIESVVEIDRIARVPRVPPHIAGLAALRSRVLTIVDCRHSLGLRRRDGDRATCTVIVTVGAHHYGLLVDEVLDVVAIEAAPRRVDLALRPGWARATAGMIDHDGEALLLLDPAALVAGPLMSPGDATGVNATLMAG